MKTVSTTKITFPETYQGYSSHPQKHIPAKYLKNLSMKIIVFRYRFYSFINFLLQDIKPFINTMLVKC